MSSLHVFHESHRSVVAKILARSDSVSIAKLLRSSAAIQDLVLSVLPLVIGERAGGSGKLADAHFREMYYDAVDQEVRTIRDGEALRELHAEVVRYGYRILGFFHHRCNPGVPLCIKHAIDSKVESVNVIFAENDNNIQESEVSASELDAVLDAGRWISGQRLLGVQTYGWSLSSCRGMWPIWSGGLWPVWLPDQLEAALLPALVVIGNNDGQTTVDADEYANIWSADVDRQRTALISIADKMRSRDGCWSMNSMVVEMTSNGVLDRVVSLLKTQTLKRDVLRLLDCMARYCNGGEDHPASQGHRVAASFQKHASLFIGCLSSPDREIRNLATRGVSDAAVRWLSGLTIDSSLVKSMINAILHQFWQEFAAGDKTQTLHPARTAIRALSNLCQAEDCETREIVGSKASECFDASCAQSIAEAIALELEDATGPGDYFERIDELFDLLETVLSTVHGPEAVASTPRLIHAVLNSLVARYRHDNDLFSKEIGILKTLGQFRREAVLEAGALHILYHLLAQMWHKAGAADSVEKFLAGLHDMPHYVGTACVLKRFSPEANLGFLCIAPGDQVDISLTEGVWSYGSCGDSHGWFPACFVWAPPLA